MSHLEQLRDAINTCLERQALVEVWLPVTVVNESNRRGAWAPGARRAKAQRTAARLTTSAAIRGARGVPLPGALVGAYLHGLVVLLTRVYSGRGRAMDSDGVSRALKACRDGVADALGIDDGDDSVDWVTTQERGAETGVRIKIYERRVDASVP